MEARIPQGRGPLLGFLPLEDFSPFSRVYFQLLGEEEDLKKKKKIEEKKEASLPDFFFSPLFRFLLYFDGCISSSIYVLVIFLRV